MNNKIMKSVALGLLALVFFPILAVYDSLLTPFSAFLVFWLCMFGVFLFSKWSLETRGFFFLAVSLALALIGKVAFKDQMLSGFFSEFMLLTGAGVGANFIAAGLLRYETQAQNGKKKS